MTSSSSSPSGLAKYLSTHPSFQDPRSSSSPLPALYADLSRQRRSNPAGYRASVEWWRDTLLDVTWRGVQLDRDPPTPTATTSADTTNDSAANTGTGASEVDRTVFRLDESTKARWTVDGVGRPLGLGTVISELEKDSTVVPLQTFLKASAPISGPASKARGLRSYVPTPSGVASALLLTPAKWAASQLISLATGGGDDDEGYSQDETLFRAKRGDWVCYPLVHRLASSFLAHHYEDAHSPLSCLMTTAAFRAKLSTVCETAFNFRPSERDASLVLRHLTRDRSAAVVSDGLVKLGRDENTPLTQITEEDRSVVAVTETLRRLDLQIAALEAQISARTEQAKAALRAGAKTRAASHVRSRRALDEVLAKRVDVRDNLAAVVLKIEQAQSDAEVVRAYEASASVLESVLSRDELQMERVDKTMERLQDGLAAQKEVDDVLRAGVDDGVDDEEVLEELRELEKAKAAEDQKVAEEAGQDKVDELQARLDRLRLPEASQPTADHEQAGTTAPSPSQESSKQAVPE